MLRYGSKKQLKILVSKALYKIPLSIANIIVIDSLETCDKERDFYAKPSSLGKTILGCQTLFRD